ncbi:sinapine esterase-like isoform X2 [Ananas comosus]|uniref:Sinapine esterase-like isoform X2 n=1 Tax=Ananas comosus TaxID=4615 RepID=A0A6P5GKP1_ANACO|nr:sinapine esterase-like isoform X2 [Ananas comosus]
MMTNFSFCPLIILSFLLVFQSHGTSAAQKDCFVNAIYSFGDSIADTGNLLREGPVGFFATIGSYPYGETFKKPTGRCSDGLLMIDFFAMALNLSFINPYLDKSANFDNGANFAVAGATALDRSFFIERGIYSTFTNNPLSAQLDWFKAHLNSTCSSQQDCAKRLGQSLFLLGEIGGNDYNYAFFQGRSMEEVTSYVPEVVKSITDTAKEVISLGATQLVVPGNFPIGCSPSYLSMFYTADANAYDERKCLKSFNSFSSYHNKQLQAAVDELRRAYPNVTIMYADYHEAFVHLLDHASDFDSLLTACCGSGGEYNFEISAMCGAPGSSSCSDPNQYISWDGLHLTQEAYRVMAQSLIMEGFAYPNDRVQETWTC